MNSYLLGIDIGTTATKSIILHPTKGIVAENEYVSTLQSPHSVWAEANPDEWWDNVARGTGDCLSEANIAAHEVAGVGVTGMVPTLIILDKNGKHLRPSIQQNDARAFSEIQYLRQNLNEQEVLIRTGSAITQQSIGPKVLWLNKNEPEIMNSVVHLMGAYDFIVYKMTGVASCERNWALESGLFDLHHQNWNAELLDISKIRREWLGQIHWPSDVVGHITTQAAERLGLKTGTPVVAGSADHIASAFSAGLNEPGDLLVKLGGAGDILYCIDDIVVDHRLFLDYHVAPGKFLLNGCMATSGSILKWFRQHLTDDTPFSILDKEAGSVCAGSQNLILLPYFLGEKTPINDPLARGVWFGLTLGHSRAHMFRSVLEGIAYGFKHHLAVLAEKGLAVTKARVTNGGARSDLWKQITADVLGLPLEHVAQHPGSSLGAAFIAGIGVGVFQRWEEIENFIQIDTVVRPDPTNHEKYNRLFITYLDLYRSLKDTFPRLNNGHGN
ncbi:MAG: carbohydrate kinase [Deltaproteobacteria bacterium]|nr:MAG: carbohydrate kinase [Deltaproteobacteria bacterium]